MRNSRTSKNIHGEVEVPHGNIKKLAKKASKRIDNDVDGDVDHNDPKAGKFGEFVPSVDGKKRVTTSMKEAKNGRCPAGQYYCYTNKECKPIPKGFMVDPEGMLRKENGHSVDEPKNGNGNGNGNGGNGMSEETKKDHEYSMARSQLKTVMNAAKRLNKKMGKKGEGELKAWVQSKITKAADYIDTAADYVTNEETVSEEGLRDWFGKSKSKDGKKGWVQVVSGKPCARQPGQKSTPKCVSSAKRASMSKSERISAQRRKRAADPNQPQKSGAAKPTYVSTDKPKMNSVKEATEFVDLPLNVEIPNNIRDFNLGLMFRESLDTNSGMLFIFDESAQQSFHMTETRIPLDIAFITEEGIIESIKELEPFEESPVASEGEVLYALEVNRGWFAENNVEVGDEIQIEEGKKDACYHKVKSRYSVWPSAYASGALVKCRKVGAKNWGNKTKKEEFEIEEKFKTQYGDKTKLSQSSERKSLGRGSSIKDGSKKSGYESKKEFRDQSMKLRKHRERFGDLAKEENDLNEKCWPGYEKKGMKTMFGKRYPNCVKKTKKEEVEHVEEAVRIPAKTGNLVDTYFNFRGKYYMLKMFFPQVSVPKRSDVQDQISKVYPGAKLLSYKVSEYEPGEPILHAEGAAWTKKEGKNKSGGLNEKGRKSYERENPGSDLKAPSKKVGNPRRASFCARMKGMKKKLTSSKTANDPDSRINKSLRAWNC
jgi:uncharacterized membrane protein (UPF0127 family)